jgi:hypothetical protein
MKAHPAGMQAIGHDVKKVYGENHAPFYFKF